MADKRKLQGEIDRCLKKIQEGLEAFDDIWKKVHGTNNTNQKEKFEADLKKEIKKLQRLRDQIKTWVMSADIKDKETLIDYRKKIESKMEQFKVIERETKTKAYSKEGLMGTNGKIDPKEKEKEDITNWLQHCISELGVQSDGIEGLVELLTGKRKKLNKEDQSKLDLLKARLVKNKWHVNKLEAILRLVDNGASIVEQIGDMKESVEDYISLYESNSDDLQDDMYDDIYDDFDLDDIAAMQHDLLMTSPADFDTDSQHSSHSSTSANHSTPAVAVAAESPSPITTSSSTSSSHSKSGSKNNLMLKISSSTTSTTSTTTTPGGSKVPPTPTKLTTPNTPSTPSSEVSSAGKVSLPTSSGLGYAQVAWSHHSGTAGKVVSSSPKLSHSSASGVNGLVSAPQLVQPPSQSTSSIANTPTSRATTQSSPAPTPAAGSTVSAASNAPVAAGSEPTQQQLSGMSQQQVQQLIQQQQLLQQKRQQQQQQGDGLVVNGLSPGEGEVNQQGGETLASLSLKTLAHNAAAASAGSVESQQNGGDGKSNAAPTPAVLRPDQALISSSGETKAAPLLAATNGEQPKPLQQQQLLQAAQQQQQQALQQHQGGSSGGTQVTHLNPLLGISPLGHHPVNQDHVYTQKMLEASFLRLPYPCDSERVRLYFPSNPCPTPQWYPQITPPHLNTFEFFTRLDTDTLFFMFYYMEGTKTQYWAAKALKQKSWRFHTKYMMWFQRHEEPKAITEEYEQGTYIYFDYEKWGQRKKEGFRFEYKYLEDQELA